MWNRLTSRAALLVGAFTIASTVATAGPLPGRAVREVTLPAGTVLPLTLDSYVASDASRIDSNGTRLCPPARTFAPGSPTSAARASSSDPGRT